MIRSVAIKTWPSLIVLAYMISALLAGAWNHVHAGWLDDTNPHAGAAAYATVDSTCDEDHGSEPCTTTHVNCHHGFFVLTAPPHLQSERLACHGVRLPRKPASLAEIQDSPPPKSAWL